MIVGSSFSAIGALVLLDRTGKGVRTAPRDAMISLSSSPGMLGTGVRRAPRVDTTGAMLGPLAAFGLLALRPDGYESVFLVSFCVAVVGLAVLCCSWTRARSGAGRAAEEAPPSCARRSACSGCRASPG